jgi:prepilin-type processing-associated H-X9-DG protein
VTHRSMNIDQNVCHYIGIAGNYPRAAFDILGFSGIGMFGYDRETRLEDIKDGASRTLMVVESAWDNGMWTVGGKATVRGLEDPARIPYGGKQGQFRNAHSESINALFADGSVRTLSRDLNSRAFEAMVTIADGDEVPDF